MGPENGEGTPEGADVELARVGADAEQEARENLRTGKLDAEYVKDYLEERGREVPIDYKPQQEKNAREIFQNEVGAQAMEAEVERRAAEDEAKAQELLGKIKGTPEQ